MPTSRSLHQTRYVSIALKATCCCVPAVHVVQDIAVSKNIKLFCGDREFEWDFVRNAVRLLNRNAQYEALLKFIQNTLEETCKLLAMRASRKSSQYKASETTA